MIFTRTIRRRAPQVSFPGWRHGHLSLQLQPDFTLFPCHFHPVCDFRLSARILFCESAKGTRDLGLLWAGQPKASPLSPSGDAMALPCSGRDINTFCACGPLALSSFFFFSWFGYLERVLTQLIAVSYPGEDFCADWSFFPIVAF